MQGRMRFKALENIKAVISNEGTLQVIDGGALVLLGQQIKNEGLLIAHFGTVALAAGSDITVKFETDSNLLSIQINQSTLADILKLDDTQILNSGIIQAHGGNVVLTTTQASKIKTSIIKRDESRVFSFTTGTIVERNGEIFLAGPGGDISNIAEVNVSNEANAGTIIFDARNINNSGNLIADSETGNGGNITLNANDTTLLTGDSLVSAQAKQNGSGGKVQVLGNQVGLTDNAQINANGGNDGGEVLVGGDYQNKNTKTVYLFYEV